MADYRSTDAPLTPDRSILVVALHGRVHGIDRDTGEIRWLNDLGGWHSTGHVSLAVGYGVVVAAAETGGIHCLEYLTGKTRWQEETQASGRATVLIEPDHIVCVKAGYVDAYTPSGKRIWQQPLRGAGTGTAAVGYPGNVVQADAIGR
jgi:outer membrane protein assembly factor BamB